MTVGIKDVKAWLGNDLAELLDFTVEGDYIVISPKQFIHDKTKWEMINKKLVEHDGEYKGGLGKGSHWRVPLVKQSGDWKSKFHEAIQMLLDVEKQLEKK